MTRILHLIPLLALTLGTGLGCIGLSPPHFLQMKPYTLFRGGDQLGRDQIANRYLVSMKLFPVKGLYQNEILTILGEPQERDIQKPGVSEDWYFVYYKRYKTWPHTPKGSFLIRFYQGKAIDVIKIH